MKTYWVDKTPPGWRDRAISFIQKLWRYFFIIAAVFMVSCGNKTKSVSVPVYDEIKITPDTVNGHGDNILFQYEDSSYEMYWSDKRVGYFYKDSLVIDDSSGAINILFQSVRYMQKLNEKEMNLVYYLEIMEHHSAGDNSKEYKDALNNYAHYKQLQ